MSKLPILMYHNVSNNYEICKDLTIFTETLEQHFKYIVSKKYTTFHFSELENKTQLPIKSIVITFDDCTKAQLDFAYPLLLKYNLKATFFVPFELVEKQTYSNKKSNLYMTFEDFKSLNSNIIELGNHSYSHKNYSNLSIEEINSDLKKSINCFSQNNLNICKTIAYPYGKYPKKELSKSEFFKILENNNVVFGLRIGNKINRFPFKNKYEIKRINIKNEDNLLRFKLKLIFGKLKLF
jgi:peptidoglycan/xylan/chitin deacetylase (PgdA/CDA1 family)